MNKLSMLIGVMTVMVVMAFCDTAKAQCPGGVCRNPALLSFSFDTLTPAAKRPTVLIPAKKVQPIQAGEQSTSRKRPVIKAVIKSPKALCKVGKLLKFPARLVARLFGR